MDEFIREVDEDYRREQIAQIWRRYSGLIIAVAVLFVAGVGAWRYWQYVQVEHAQRSAMRYQDAVKLSRDAKTEESEKALSDLAASATPGYRVLARFRLAAERGKQDAEAGAKAYDELAQDGSLNGTLQDLARLRAAMLRMDKAKPDMIDPQLERLAAPTNPWRHTARELLGLEGLKRGDMTMASRWFDDIAADRDTPAGLRSRLEIYTALVAGGPVKTQ